jgi:hypothetical protein
MDTPTKERPILFSGPMINALLNGTKTQTRRIIKPQPPSTHRIWNSHGDDELVFFTDHPTQGEKGNVLHWVCPYGAPGDRLWVRETWRTIARFDDWSPKQIEEGAHNAAVPADWIQVEYADRMRKNWAVHDPNQPGRLRPSIHMPRWASRITLEVVSVRVEQIQSIREEDAIAEGICNHPDDPHPARDYFMDLWDSINAKRGHGWESNPFVWCVAFRRLTP